DAGCQEPPLSGNSPLTSSHLGPALQEGQAWRAGVGGGLGGGLRGGLAPFLPWVSSYLKCLTFLSNFLLSLLSLLALAIGLWGLAIRGSLGHSWGGPLPADPMLGLVLGGLAVSAVSLADCLGTLCENACLLRCFSGGLLAFLVLEAVVGGPGGGPLGPTAGWPGACPACGHHPLPGRRRPALPHRPSPARAAVLRGHLLPGLAVEPVVGGRHSMQHWVPAQWALPSSLTPRACCRIFNCSSPRVQACSLPASCCINPWEDGASVNEQCGLGALGLDEDAAQSVWLRGNIRAVGGYLIVVVVVQGAELLLALAGYKGTAESPGVDGEGRPVHCSSRPDAQPSAKPSGDDWEEPEKHGPQSLEIKQGQAGSQRASFGEMVGSWELASNGLRSPPCTSLQTQSGQSGHVGLGDGPPSQES
ncbi:hypothetical protein HPG69_018678, partial [Diceros bicornis minor]